MRILVLDGGGQLGTFEWGAMTEFARQGIKHDYFDFYIGTSAGAFNAAFFLDDYFEQGKRIWLEHLPKKFWKKFKNDIPALDNILRNVEPLNCSLIKSRAQKIFVSMTNHESGQPDFICLNDEPDIITSLLACCAMPFLSGPAKLNGKTYYDGGLSVQPPIQKALTFPNAEIWAIINKPKGARLTPAYWRMLSWLYAFDPKLQKLLAQCPINQNQALELIDTNPKIRVIRPSQNLPISFRSTNLSLIAKTFELGQFAAKDFLTSL